MAALDIESVEHSVIPETKEFQLWHFQQRFDWDCGLSCILMTLPRHQHGLFHQEFDRICAEGEFDRSTWTIDLCFVLKRFGISFRFLTKTLGVDPAYETHSYYRNRIPREGARVNKKFEEGFKQGMNIEQKTISFAALIEHMAIHGPVIILTNSALLCCDFCKRNKTFFRRNRYSGHYVVLCGYDLHNLKVKYHDPAKDNHMCVTSFELMHKARTAHGTDEDVILLYY